MFKKKKIEKGNSFVKIFTILAIFLIFLLAIFFIYFIKNIDFLSIKNINKHTLNNIKNNLNNNINDVKNNLSTSSNVKTNIEKNTNNKINILLLWRWWELNDAPDLTDTIILASINKGTQTITMLSIPRDLYVKYWDDKFWKINQIYAIEKAKLLSKNKWLKALENKITEITWEKIDYYVNIDFKGFSAFIDAIWWVKITVPHTLIDNRYPDWNWGYRRLIIKKWTWLFNWDVALMYARSRHSTSDFARSQRQQQIIQAVKDKLNEWWFFSKIYKIKKFYDVFKKYVDTDLTMLDMIKIFNQVWTWNKYKVLSFNLNDSCFFWDPNCRAGWLLYVPKRDLFWWSSVVLPNWAYLWNISDYKQIKIFSNLIFNNPNIFKENIKINIYNATKIRWIAWDLATSFIRFWLNIPKNNSIWNIHNKIFKNSVIYYNNSIKDSSTLEFVKMITWIKNMTKVFTPIKSKDDEVWIEVVLWNDYKKVFKNLENNLK